MKPLYELALNVNLNWRYLATGGYFLRAADRLNLPIKIYEEGDEVVLNIESDGHPFAKGKKLTAYYDLDVFLPRSFNMSKFQTNADIWFATHEPPYKVKPPCYVVPHATDPVLTGFRLPKVYDVAIGGRLDVVYKARAELADAIFDKYCTIIIPETDNTPDYLRMLSTGKIIFNHSLMGDINRRDFDGMALGVLLRDRSPYQHMIGNEGEHFFAYEDKDELLKTIDELLKNKYGRLEDLDHISTAWAFHNHTYDQRLSFIYYTIAKHLDDCNLKAS